MKKASMSSLCLLSEQSSVAWSIVSCEGVAVLICFKRYAPLQPYFVARAQTATLFPKDPQSSFSLDFLRFFVEGCFMSSYKNYISHATLQI